MQWLKRCVYVFMCVWEGNVEGGFEVDVCRGWLNSVCYVQVV